MDWFYADNGQQVGPLAEEEFDGAIQAGKILPTTLVWHAGLTDWQPYSTLRRQTATSNVALHTAGQSAPQTSCMECGQSFAQADMIRYGDGWICATCKPVFIQKLKEGLRPGERLHYAGFWIRVGAKIIDSILSIAVTRVLELLFEFSTSSLMDSNAMLPFLQAGKLLLSMVIGIVYSVYFLGKFGATPGKMACRIYVSSEDGSPISYGRAFGRLWAEMLSAIILGIGYLMVAWDPEKRALHDRLCNTRVVHKN